MELKPGYKQTVVGVIPEDWLLMSAAEICLKIQDGTHFSPKTGGDGFLYVTSKNIRSGFMDLSSSERIDENQHRIIYKRCDVKKGDLLLTKDGANTGNAALNTLDEEISLLSSVAFLRFDPKKHAPSYFLQQTLSCTGQRQIQDLMSGNAITRLTLEKIKGLRYPVPPTLAEQRAIAEALSDADALIESLEQLIAKKRLVKQGVMQELLTGRRRLPGFTGKWELKSLGSLGKLRSGSGFPISYQGEVDGNYPFFKVSDMNNEGNSTFLINSNNWISEDTRRKINANTFPKKTIVFAKIGAGIFLERKRILYQESCLDNNLMGFIPDPSVANFRYVYYLFQAILIGKLVAATALPSINGKDIAALVYGFPSIDEQIAISAVICDFDEEIIGLNDKLGKARQIKQGMMQELLTGRIRLK